MAEYRYCVMMTRVADGIDPQSTRAGMRGQLQLLARSHRCRQCTEEAQRIRSAQLPDLKA